MENGRLRGRWNAVLPVLLLLVLLLAACAREAEQAPSASPEPPAPSFREAELAWIGETPTGSDLTPARLADALQRAEAEPGADLTGAAQAQLAFAFSDGSRETCRLFADIATSSVWILTDDAIRLADEDAAAFLADRAFDALYLAEPLRMSAAVGAIALPADTYGITAKAGHALNGNAAHGELPVIYVERAEDLLPTFAPAPDDYEILLFDSEGAAPREIVPDAYYCEIAADYRRDAWSGSVRFAARVVVCGKPELNLSSDKIAQGRTVLATVRNPIPDADYSIYLPHLAISVPVGNAGGVRAAFVQANITGKPGEYTLELRRTLEKDVVATVATASYSVAETDFQRQDLVTSGETQAIYTTENLTKDNQLVEDARASSNPSPYWSGLFIRPVEGRISTEFGMARYVNQKLQSRHSGIDIAAAENTGVFAPAAGKVVFAGALTVNGNTVIIDHGMNVFSSYSHLNTMTVSVGDQIAQKDVIGLVGSTGYSTGPHLHYTVMVNGSYIDPRFFETHDLFALPESSE